LELSSKEENMRSFKKKKKQSVRIFHHENEIGERKPKAKTNYQSLGRSHITTIQKDSHPPQNCDTMINYRSKTVSQ